MYLIEMCGLLIVCIVSRGGYQGNMPQDIWSGGSFQCFISFGPLPSVSNTVFWESSTEEKFREFRKSGSIHNGFLTILISAGIFIYEIA